MIHFLAIAAILVASVGHAQKRQSVVGCYFASPALTYSAKGEPEHGDSSWAVVVLGEDGRVRRPLLRPFLDRNSSWKTVGDTLKLVVHDGLVGWKLSLLPDTNGWRGNATYLTDVIVADWKAPEHSILLTRRSCRDTA
jgi:hypothetical protein